MGHYDSCRNCPRCGKDNTWTDCGCYRSDVEDKKKTNKPDKNKENKENK